jgi:hypothetical protein
MNLSKKILGLNQSPPFKVRAKQTEPLSPGDIAKPSVPLCFAPGTFSR